MEQDRPVAGAGGERPLLSLCMIVKDEAQDLPRCLASAREVVDEIIVVDTGSTDETPAIAEGFGAKVVSFPWTGSFSDARNESLRHATGQWLLLLDADEALTEGRGREQLREWLQRESRYDGFILPMVSFVGIRSHREGHVHPMFRLFRNVPGIRFERSLHEQIAHSIRAVKPDAQFATLPVWLEHSGYLSPSVRGKQKVQRNFELAKRDLKDNTGDPFAWYNLAREYMRQSRWQAAYHCLRRALAHLGETYTPYYFRAVCDATLCLQRMGRTRQALALLQEAQRMPLLTPDFAFLEGQVQFSQENWTEALGAFRRCLRFEDQLPTDFDWTEGSTSYTAWYWIGLCHLKRGEYAEAVRGFTQSLRTALAKDRYYEPPLTSLTRLQLPTCRSAQDLLQWFDTLSPGGLTHRPQLALLTVKALLMVYPLPGFALDAAQTLMDRSNQGRDTLDENERAFAEGKLRLHQRQYLASAACLAPIPLHAPEGGTAWNLRITALALVGQTSEALTACEDDPVWRWLLGRWAGAAEVPTSTLPAELAPALRGNFADLLALLLQLGEFERFEQTLPLAEWVWDDATERAMEIAKVYDQFECWDLVLETLVPVAQTSRIDRQSWNLLARACRKKGMYSEAADILLQLGATDDSKESAFGHYLELAGALIAQGKGADAQQVVDFVSQLAESAGTGKASSPAAGARREPAVSDRGRQVGGDPPPPQGEDPALDELLGKLDGLKERLQPE